MRRRVHGAWVSLGHSGTERTVPPPAVTCVFKNPSPTCLSVDRGKTPVLAHGLGWQETPTRGCPTSMDRCSQGSPLLRAQGVWVNVPATPGPTTFSVPELRRPRLREGGAPASRSAAPRPARLWLHCPGCGSVPCRPRPPYGTSPGCDRPGDLHFPELSWRSRASPGLIPNPDCPGASDTETGRTCANHSFPPPAFTAAN